MCWRARETQGVGSNDAVLKGRDSPSGPSGLLLEMYFLGPTQTYLGAGRAVLILQQALPDVLMQAKEPMPVDVKRIPT